MQNGQLLAAIDLGSNSFRLEIGVLEHGHIRRVEYLKETVRQGNGLDAERMLSKEAMERGWECLARFSERLSGFGPKFVRAVATQTLREAKNRDEFLSQAEKILGFPIEVISGREEARLIYSGVVNLLPQSDEKRLVIDIGGRSTELIVGQGYKPKTMESYRVGSVKWSMKYFADGQFTPMAFEWAEVAAKAVLDEALALYPKNSWDVAYGSSGTIGAVADVLQAAGWPEEMITKEGLDWLKEKLIKAGHADSLRLEGVKDDRKPVIGGGLAILFALFDLMQIDKMHSALGALRHGVLYDLLQREENTDLRSAMVVALGNRFAVDLAQAERVQRTAQDLFKGIIDSNSIDTYHARRLERKLCWASHLLEIGTRISHSDFHKHGAYILDNADLPGFSMPELHRLSQLILGHRGKLKKIEIELKNPEFMLQLLSLRLAAILCHARRDPDLKGVSLKRMEGSNTGFVIHCKKAWLQQWPQSAHLLREECIAWQKSSWQLELIEINGKTI
jgi:exopolyphosphatase / guanosine-5'-triphosphate,3'-diphosphate pyrophosphatase